MKILAIGAHPDDCEIKVGGTAIQLARSGHTVRFVSATNGEKGHHQQEGQPLIARRKQEAAAAAEILGVESQVLDIPDAEIQPDLATRWRFIRLIREFAPDYIITHRTLDYHPDHRITGQLVQDCSYLVRVPHVCPDAKVPARQPVILFMSDGFTLPAPFRPDVVVNIDPAYEQKLQALHCHASQVYEWLPWIDGRADAVPENETEKLTWLSGWLGPRDERIASINRHELERRHGATGTEVRYAEAFEISEYGRQVTAEQVRADWNLQ